MNTGRLTAAENLIRRAAKFLEYFGRRRTSAASETEITVGVGVGWGDVGCGVSPDPTLNHWPDRSLLKCDLEQPCDVSVFTWTSHQPSYKSRITNTQQSSSYLYKIEIFKISQAVLERFES